MNWAFWFMAIQGVWCLGGAIGFLAQGKLLFAGVWVTYSVAQIFWSYIALRG